MSKYFDKFGNPIFENGIDKAAKEMYNICNDLFAKMLKNGASIVEVRAVKGILTSWIASSDSLIIMEEQQKLAKN